MKHEPVKDHAERKRISALIEQCEKEQTMKQLTINPNNRQYYSEDFIKGFECGTQRQLEADKADRPQGEWIYGEHNVAMCDGYRCNRCDFFVPWDYEHKFIDFINDYHFCPNCGCRMKGADDER